MPPPQRRLPRPSFPRLLPTSRKPNRTSDPLNLPTRTCDSLPTSFPQPQFSDDSSSTSLKPLGRPASDTRAERRHGLRMPSKWNLDRSTDANTSSDIQQDSPSTLQECMSVSSDHSYNLLKRNSKSETFSESDQHQQTHEENNANEVRENDPTGDSESVADQNIEQLPPAVGLSAKGERCASRMDDQTSENSCSCAHDMTLLRTTITSELQELRRMQARTAESAQETLRAAALLEAHIDEMRVVHAREPSPASVLFATIVDAVATILLFLIRMLITQPFKLVSRFFSSRPQLEQPNPKRCSWRLSGGGFSDDQFLDSVAKRLSFSATDWNAKS